MTEKKTQGCDLKAARPEDADELIEFMRRFYEGDHMEFREPIARRGLKRMFDDQSAGYLCWIKDGEARIGYIAVTFCLSLEFGGPTAVVDELYLEPSHRGRGIGFEVLKLIEVTCRERGILALHLEVDRGNSHAQALYRKAGYIDRNNFLLTKWLSDGPKAI
jgi:ribosomal protein S18 acetylase RimI-like enzyme